METEEAKAYMAKHKEGTYTLLDVRQPGEYEKDRIPGAKLIALPELPDRLGELDPDKPIIPYCAVGGRSRAAAQKSLAFSPYLLQNLKYLPTFPGRFQETGLGSDQGKYL